MGVASKSMTLFNILSFKIRLGFSWIFLTVLVTWSLAKGYFPAYYLELDDSTYWWMAGVGPLGLFGSIIVHKLTHSYVSRHHGIPINGITLYIFGAVAQMDEEPPSPKSEFLMAIALPAS